MRKIYLFILLLFIPIIKTNAMECNYNEISRLKKIASNVNVIYEYIEENGDVTFNVTLTNLNKEIYFIDSMTKVKHNFSSSEVVLNNYKSNSTIKYDFYASNGCTDKVLYTIRINLPSYNKYYSDPICQGLENYTLCQKWSSHNLSYDQFVTKVSEYKESLNQDDKEEEKKDDETYSIFHSIIQFIVKYYYIFIIVLIIVCSILIYRDKKKSDIYS